MLTSQAMRVGGLAATVGVVGVGVALLEVALVPGLVIGGAAVLAPRYLPRLRRALPSMPKRAPRAVAIQGPARKTGGLGLTQAVAKTITFRVIVTTLDFSTNFIVLGEATTAAGLSAFALVTGPIIYFAHETAWNYFGPAVQKDGTAVELPVRLGTGRRSVTISRALAKTISFRTIATAIDFTTLYIVVGSVGTAVGLSAVGFVLGPFVYYGHEAAWDYYGKRLNAAKDGTEIEGVAVPA